MNIDRRHKKMRIDNNFRRFDDLSLQKRRNRALTRGLARALAHSTAIHFARENDGGSGALDAFQTADFIEEIVESVG